MNREAIRQNKPIVECAMYDLEAHIYTVLPNQTACVACLYPEKPPAWKREFPVFGAVSGMVACLGAMEAIKLISGLGENTFRANGGGGSPVDEVPGIQDRTP